MDYIKLLEMIKLYTHSALKKQQPCSTLPANLEVLCKEIVTTIGYQKTMVLKHWKDAFPKENLSMLEFKKLQDRNDGGCVLHITCQDSSVALLLHYQKIFIIEKLSRIVGSKFIVDVKIARRQY